MHSRNEHYFSPNNCCYYIQEPFQYHTEDINEFIDFTNKTIWNEILSSLSKMKIYNLHYIKLKTKESYNFMIDILTFPNIKLNLRSIGIEPYYLSWWIEVLNLLSEFPNIESIYLTYYNKDLPQSSLKIAIKDFKKKKGIISHLSIDGLIDWKCLDIFLLEWMNKAR